MIDFHRQIRLAQGRWNRALFWGLSGAGLGVGLLLGGTVVLVGRASGYRWDLPGTVAGLVLGLGWALWRYHSRKVDAAQMATLLDMRQGGTGAVLFELETGLKQASTGTETAGKLTHPRPDLRRVGRSMIPGAAFFIATLLIPVRLSATSSVDPITEQRLEELTQLAQMLDDNLDLKEELRQEIADNLEALEAESEQDRPSGDALREALDQLESRLESTAAEHAQALEDVVRKANQAAADAAAEDPTQRKAALDQLGDLAQQMQNANMLPELPLTQDLLQKLAEMGLSPEGLEQLKNLAQQGKLSELGKLAQELGLNAQMSSELAQAMSQQLSAEALAKLAELAQQGLLNQQSGQAGKPMTAEQLEELLRRLDNQPGGT
jgi:hypothetical protein